MYDQIEEAIWKEDILQLALLLKQPGSKLILNEETLHRRCLLQHAVNSGNLASIELLLNAGANPNVPCRKSILEIAAQSNSKETIDLLFSKGLDPNMYIGKSTAFAYTCNLASLEMIKLLIAKGADLCEFEQPSSSPLTFACSSRHPEIKEIVDYILRYHKNEVATQIPYAMHRACYIWDNPGVIEILIQHGADVNAEVLDNMGNNMTPLLEVMCQNEPSLEVIQCLLNNGANMHAKHNSGLSPLDFAEGLRDPRILHLFSVHNT